jgi:hypothetical protein
MALLHTLGQLMDDLMHRMAFATLDKNGAGTVT